MINSYTGLYACVTTGNSTLEITLHQQLKLARDQPKVFQLSSIPCYLCIAFRHLHCHALTAVIGQNITSHIQQFFFHTHLLFLEACATQLVQDHKDVEINC